MKQVVQIHRTGELKVDEVPAPVVRAGGLLIGTQASVISVGTERSTVAVAKKSLAGKAMERPDLVRKVLDKAQKDGVVDTMKMVSSRLDTPVALGYSAAGVVLEVGSGVEGFSPGDRVAYAGQNYASHAEVVLVPRNLSVRIPDGVDFDEAAYVALGAIALQGLRQADPRLGEIVAVVGLGLLGQLTVQLLKANGCRVIASDPVPEKRALAREFGVDSAVPPEDLVSSALSATCDQGVDAVIITASTKTNRPVEVAGEIARKRGRIVAVGAVGMDLPRSPYYEKELEFRLSTSYGPGRYDPAYEEAGQDYPYGYVRWTERRNMEAFLELISSGKVDVKSLTSHRYPIAAAEQAYNTIMDGAEPCLGVLLSYPQVETLKRSHSIKLSSARGVDRMTLGVIGAGKHVTDALLPALGTVPGVRFSAVCTERGINAKAVAARVKAGYCTSDYREILEDPEINSVLIGTRHDTHGPIIVEALRAGKHVFVEKPLCLTETELDEITAAYEEGSKQGLQLAVGFNRRYSAHMQKAKEFLGSRANPLVMTYRVNAGAIPGGHWIQDAAVGGGRILGEACHFVDYLQELCGAHVSSVWARCVGGHSSGIIHDQAVISLDFADGSIGSIVYAAGGNTRLAKERCEIFGDGKSLVMDDFKRTELYDRSKKTTFKTGKRDKGFQVEMAAFCAAVTGKQPSSMPFQDIHAVTRTCFLAVESLRTGKSYRV